MAAFDVAALDYPAKRSKPDSAPLVFLKEHLPLTGTVNIKGSSVRAATNVANSPNEP